MCFKDSGQSRKIKDLNLFCLSNYKMVFNTKIVGKVLTFFIQIQEKNKNKRNPCVEITGSDLTILHAS